MTVSTTYHTVRIRSILFVYGGGLWGGGHRYRGSLSNLLPLEYFLYDISRVIFQLRVGVVEEFRRVV